MSFQTWHIYGFGARTDNIKVKSLETLQELIALSPQLKEDFSTWFKDNNINNPTIEDYYNYSENDGCGLAAILKMVIFDVENISLTSCNSIERKNYLVYEPLYPWGLTEVDRTLTKDKLEQLFIKYFSMISDTVPELDFQEIENGG